MLAIRRAVRKLTGLGKGCRPIHPGSSDPLERHLFEAI
jgi:hypothetical protein